MKRCPNCYRTFADSMRFCQADGTALIDETEDQYKTTVGVGSFTDDDDLLQLSDEANTVVSPNRGGAEFNSSRADDSDDLLSFGNPTVPMSKPFETTYQPPPYSEPPPVKELESPFGSGQSAFNQNPFESNQPAFGQPPPTPEQWTPPPAPEAGWQSQNIGANTPFQPPVIQNQNQVLPIISLVLGIVSAVCCWIGFLTGPAALITGYLGKKNADTNPQQFGGSGMALAGMITGGIGALISIVYFLIVIVGLISGPR